MSCWRLLPLTLGLTFCIKESRNQESLLVALQICSSPPFGSEWTSRITVRIAVGFNFFWEFYLTSHTSLCSCGHNRVGHTTLHSWLNKRQSQHLCHAINEHWSQLEGMSNQNHLVFVDLMKRDQLRVPQQHPGGANLLLLLLKSLFVIVIIVLFEEQLHMLLAPYAPSSRKLQYTVYWSASLYTQQILLTNQLRMFNQL